MGNLWIVCQSFLSSFKPALISYHSWPSFRFSDKKINFVLHQNHGHQSLSLSLHCSTNWRQTELSDDPAISLSTHAPMPKFPFSWWYRNQCACLHKYICCNSAFDAGKGARAVPSDPPQHNTWAISSGQFQLLVMYAPAPIPVNRTIHSWSRAISVAYSFGRRW